MLYVYPPTDQLSVRTKKRTGYHKIVSHNYELLTGLKDSMVLYRLLNFHKAYAYFCKVSTFPAIGHFWSTCGYHNSSWGRYTVYVIHELGLKLSTEGQRTDSIMTT